MKSLVNRGLLQTVRSLAFRDRKGWQYTAGLVLDRASSRRGLFHPAGISCDHGDGTFDVD